jgi:hypothetical protein
MNADTTTPRRRPVIRTMVIASCALASVSILSIAAFGGTYALWHDDAPLNASPINSGSLELKVDGATDLVIPQTGYARMLPGDRINRQVTIATSGSVDSDVSVTATVAGPHIIRLAPGACPSGSLSGTQLAGPALSSTPRDLGVFVPGVAQTACLQVELPVTAPDAVEGVQTNYTLRLVAAQVAE